MNGEDLLLTVLAGDLTPLQADMLIDDVLRYRNRRELAEEYGVSPGRAGQVLEAARRKIRLRGCFAMQAAA